MDQIAEEWKNFDGLWFLREGDFLPERIESLCRNWERSEESIIKFLSEAGNLFPSKEEAMEVSKKLREIIFLHQLRQGRVLGIHTTFGIPSPFPG